MKCITCGKNEAINNFYKECQGCINDYLHSEYMKIWLNGSDTLE